MRLVHLLLPCVVLASCGDGGGRAHTIEHAREGMSFEDAIKAFGQPHEAKAALTLGPVVVWYQTAARADVVAGSPAGVLHGACKMSAQLRGSTLRGVRIEGSTSACARFAELGG